MKNEIKIILGILLLPWLAGACSTPPLRAPDYTSPEKTLLTFHNAFQNKATSREYECFSYEFKKNQGNMNLSSYYEVRRQFEEKYPLESFFFSMQDLRDNILDKRLLPDGLHAQLKLSLGGKETTIWFVRETVYRFEFDDEGRLEEDLTDPLETLVSDKGDRLIFDLPLSSKTSKRKDALRKILVEKNWKFLDFSFLHEKIDVST
ncbi:MAG: hypothetical protein ACYTG7_10890 [Planctomycetota bacterium]|jgi:hypothetical protein